MARADYEGRILRSVVYRPKELVHILLTSLQEKHFTSPLYRQIYRIIKNVAAANNNVNRFQILDALEDERIPFSTIDSAWSSTYDKESIKDATKQVKNRAQLKEMNKLHERWLESTKKVSTSTRKHVVDVMTSLHELQYDDAREHDVKSVVQRAREEIERIQRVGDLGVQTDIAGLDFITDGMQRGMLWILGGYTSVGKSWFGIKFAQRHLDENVPTLFISLEMSAPQILWRLASCHIGRKDIPLKQIRMQTNLNEEQSKTVASTIEKIENQPFYIVDDVNSWAQMKSAILYYIYAHNVKCVVVDYVQNVIVPNTGGEYESLNTIVRELQHIAIKEDVFVCALSQVNRESARSSDSNVFGFKGSGNLEQAADVAMTIRTGEDPMRRLISIGKNRHGSTGEIIMYCNFETGFIQEVSQPAKGDDVSF